MGRHFNIAYTPQMSAMLHCDDIDAFVHSLRSTQPIEHLLDAWMRDNILHVIAACPKVLAFWKEKMEWPSDPGLAIVEFLGEALENIEEHDKIYLLRGNSSDAVSFEWYRGMSQNPLFFQRLSPAWIGAPGTALRQEMVACGWQACHLGQMIGYGKPANAKYWSEWVPFLETMLVYNHKQRELLHIELDKITGFKGREPEHFLRTVHSKALAEDVALAQSLCNVLWPQASHYALKLPPNFPSVPTSRRQELDLLVQMHAQLDQMGPLMDILATGHLPQETSEVLLPNQGF